MCHWHIPETHYLEQWSDVRAFDGTVSIVQPLILPLYRGRSAHEVVGIFTARPERTPYDAMRDYWKAQPQAAGQDFEKFWRRSVHNGLIEGTALPPKTVKAAGADSAACRRRPRARAGSRSTLRRTRPSTTDASPTTAGCRSCPSR